MAKNKSKKNVKNIGTFEMVSKLSTFFFTYRSIPQLFGGKVDSEKIEYLQQLPLPLPTFSFLLIDRMSPVNLARFKI